MSFEVQFNLTSNGWDYFPLPNFEVRQPKNDYELIFQLPVPTWPRKLFGKLLGVQDTPEQTNNPSNVPEPELLVQARQLIEQGSFSLCEEGVGGTYFIKDKEKSTVAVFKPVDEEPGAPNNPKGKVEKPLLPPGQGARRECAAYILDHGHFAGVPETHFLSKVKHEGFNGVGEKSGSLQRFVPNDGVSSDMGYGSFDVEDVHRIGILDIRLFNLDRNGENILLVKKQNSDNTAGHKSSYNLIPIDHSYCLPSIHNLEGAYFEWQFWPQARKPFSPETLEYIRSIDIERDVMLLRYLDIPEECIGTMVVCTLLLKKAAALPSGLTLFDIASLVARKQLDVPSQLEVLVATAEKNCAVSGGSFPEEFEILLDQTLRLIAS